MLTSFLSLGLMEDFKIVYEGAGQWIGQKEISHKWWAEENLKLLRFYLLNIWAIPHDSEVNQFQGRTWDWGKVPLVDGIKEWSLLAFSEQGTWKIPRLVPPRVMGIGVLHGNSYPVPAALPSLDWVSFGYGSKATPLPCSHENADVLLSDGEHDALHLSIQSCA